MKLMALSVLLMLFSGQALSNGGRVSTGAVEIDEKNLKSLPEKERGPAATRQKASENPRNKAFSESFERVGGDKQEQKIKAEDETKQGAREE